MDSCIYCDIFAGDEEASFVHRDGLCAAFLDVRPSNDGHVLVVPLEHCASVEGRIVAEGEQRQAREPPGRAYGPRVTEESLRIGAEGVVVIPEADEIHEDAARLVRGAKQVLFLGFAYHESNIRRLGIGDWDLNRHVTQLFKGSAYGLKDRECERKRKRWNMEMDQLRSLDYLRERVDLG